MRKIPTLFVRDWNGDPRYVTREVTPECQWVMEWEGVATRKYDGSCFMFDGTDWWARREVKEGKIAPAGFTAIGTDSETGKTVGWEPVGQSPFSRWHADAVYLQDAGGTWPNGTYELVGPKINGNPEHFEHHWLIFHTFADELTGVPRDFEGLAVWLHAHPYEGVVWHHPDGRMAKIKKRDFRA